MREATENQTKGKKSIYDSIKQIIDAVRLRYISEDAAVKEILRITRGKVDNESPEKVRANKK